mgnify:CR=1 FL=1
MNDTLPKLYIVYMGKYKVIEDYLVSLEKNQLCLNV